MNKAQLIYALKSGKYNQANYQLVVVKSLIQGDKMEKTKEEIVKDLTLKNPTVKAKYFQSGSCPVWKVLTKKDILLKSENGFKLNLTRATQKTKDDIIDLCDLLIQ
jgi:hypothetical protein